MPAPRRVLGIKLKLNVKFLTPYTSKDLAEAHRAIRRNLKNSLEVASSKAQEQGRALAKASFTRPTPGYLGDALSLTHESTPLSEKLNLGIIKRRGTFKYTTEYWQFVEFGAQHGFTVRGFFIPFDGVPYYGQIFIPASTGKPYLMKAPTPDRRFVLGTIQIFSSLLKVKSVPKAPPSLAHLGDSYSEAIKRALIESYKDLEAKFG